MSRPPATADRARLAARLFTGAGAALAVIGALGTAGGIGTGNWPLIVLGVLAVGVGVFVLLAGLGLRQSVTQSEARLEGARMDAAAAATVAAATRPTTDAAGAPTTCADEAACGVECTAACALAGLRRP